LYTIFDQKWADMTFSRLFVASLILLSLTSLARAQSPDGSIRGLVKDEQGALVPARPFSP
jgi:hypothetical protein